MLQAELGDVVYVELPEIGSEVTSGETFGVVESVKVCSPQYSFAVLESQQYIQSSDPENPSSLLLDLSGP